MQHGRSLRFPENEAGTSTQEFVHWMANNHGALSEQPLSALMLDIQVRMC